MLRTLLSFGITAAILLAIFANSWGVRWIVAPWSYDSPGPTLTGAWQGALRAQQGAEYRLYLNLRYQVLWERWPWDENLAGRAVICNRHGALYEYAVIGAADRQGKNMVLTLAYDDPSMAGLDMDLGGDWHGETIRIVPRNNPFLPDGRFVWPRPADASDASDSFAPTLLRPTDEPAFLMACGRLTQ